MSQQTAAADPLSESLSAFLSRMQARESDDARDRQVLSAVHAAVTPLVTGRAQARAAGAAPTVTPRSTGRGCLSVVSRAIPYFLLASWAFGWTPGTFNPAKHTIYYPSISCHQWNPTPGPTPGPTPTPTPPVPVGALRVIIVSDPTANETQGQLDALNSTAARSFLSANCAKDSDGRPAWRSWAPDVDPSKESTTWQAAWAAAKPMLGTLPQVVIFHGTAGKTYPLPGSEADFLTLLKSGGK